MGFLRLYYIIKFIIAHLLGESERTGSVLKTTSMTPLYC